MRQRQCVPKIRNIAVWNFSKNTSVLVAWLSGPDTSLNVVCFWITVCFDPPLFCFSFGQNFWLCGIICERDIRPAIAAAICAQDMISLSQMGVKIYFWTLYMWSGSKIHTSEPKKHMKELKKLVHIKPSQKLGVPHAFKEILNLIWEFMFIELCERIWPADDRAANASSRRPGLFWHFPPLSNLYSSEEGV